MGILVKSFCKLHKSLLIFLLFFCVSSSYAEDKTLTVVSTTNTVAYNANGAFSGGTSSYTTWTGSSPAITITRGSSATFSTSTSTTNFNAYIYKLGSVDFTIAAPTGIKIKGYSITFTGWSTSYTMTVTPSQPEGATATPASVKNSSTKVTASVKDLSTNSATFNIASTNKSSNSNRIVISEFTITYEEEEGYTTYNINLEEVTHGSISASTTAAIAGTTISLTQNADDGYKFNGWTVLDGDANEVTVTDNKFEMPASDVEVSASFVADNYSYETYSVTNSDVTSNSYTAFSNTTATNSSGAIYEGTICRGGGSSTGYYIQMNNTANITTSHSGGYLRNIKVTWAGSNYNGRYLSVYGSKEPITASTSVTSLTLVGQISYTTGETSAKIRTDANYRFFKIVANGAIYIDNFYIGWEPFTAHNVNVEYGEHGLATASPEKAKYGETVTVETAPDTDYEVDKVTLDGTELTATSENTYTFTMKDAEVNVVASFKYSPVRTENSMELNKTSYSLTSSKTLDYTNEYMVNEDYDGTVVLSTENTDLVSINGMVITGLGQGTATVTITAPQTDHYYAISKTFTVTVSPMQYVLVSKYNGHYYAAKQTVKDATLTVAEVRNVEGVIANPTDDMIWNICKTSGGYTIQDASGNYLTNNSTEFKLSATSKQIWTANSTFTKFYDSSNRSPIYRASTGGMRAYLESNAGTDDYGTCAAPTEYLTMSEEELAAYKYTRSVTSGNLGTLCLPYESVTWTGIDKVFKVTNVTTTTVTMEQVELMEAGVPYIFRSNDATITIEYQGEENKTAGSTDYLVGSYTVVDVPANSYILQNNKFKYVAEDNVNKSGKNRCYLKGAALPEGARPDILDISIDDEGTTTTISTLNAVLNNQVDIYDLSGRRQQTLQKGINIVNGKKFIVK